VEQEQKPREWSFVRELVPAWRLTRERVLGVSRIAILIIGIILTVLLLLYCVSVLFGVTLWNVLKIFAVPITVGAAVPWLNWLQKTRELEVESQRAQDEALEAYLDQMSKLLLDKERPLRQSAEADKAEEDANGRTVARARTLTVLSRFDGHRKGRVVQFLYEAGLVMKERSIVDLYQSDLREARLNGAR
jgi:hypothetical protein